MRISEGRKEEWDVSISTQIMEYVASVPETEQKHLDAQSIGDAIGSSSGKVSKLLWSLENTGRLRLIRQGRSIVGIEEVIRALPMHATQRHIGAGATPRRARKEASVIDGTAPKGVRTPVLDSYIAAARLRAALVRLEESYAQLSADYKLQAYELQGMKDRIAKKVSASVAADIAAAKPD